RCSRQRGALKAGAGLATVRPNRLPVMARAYLETTCIQPVFFQQEQPRILRPGLRQETLNAKGAEIAARHLRAHHSSPSPHRLVLGLKPHIVSTVGKRRRYLRALNLPMTIIGKAAPHTKFTYAGERL